MASSNTAPSENCFGIVNAHRAIYSGNIEQFHGFINSFKHGYLIPWETSQQLLAAAIKHRRFEIAKILLTKGCAIGDTLKLCAKCLSSGDIELVKLFLDKDPQSLHKRLAGDTLLHMAVQRDQEAMVKLLIDHGANVNLADRNGLFPLHVAAKSGNVYILKLLLDSKANIEIKSLWKRETSLLCAVKNSKINTTKELLDAGADVNCKDVFGRTPLYFSCFMNHTRVICLLLNAGADVNVIDEKKGLVPCDAYRKEELTGTPHYAISIPLPLVERLILLKQAGLYLHERNQSVTDDIFIFYFFYHAHRHDIPVNWRSVSPLLSKIKNVVIKCQQEIDLMKQVKAINGSVLYDVLKRLNKKALYSATKSEIQLLKLVISEEMFPMYSVILKPHLKYAELRNGLLAQAQAYLASLIESSKLQIPFIPEEIRVLVVSHLENWALELFINGI